jgi:hypothetical protein
MLTMGQVPGREYGIARAKREALVGYIDHQLVALNEVKPFFLRVVQMAHRPAWRNHKAGTSRHSTKYCRVEIRQQKGTTTEPMGK